MRKLALLLFFIAPAAFGTTRTAATCNQADVQAQVNLSANGDTVLIPAGTCTWGNNTSGNLALSISVAITLQGAGQGVTTIIDNEWKGDNGTCGHSVGVIFWTSGNFPLRMTNFTIQGMAPDPQICNPGHVTIQGTSQSMRVDHITFTNMQTSGLSTFQNLSGVVDHCTFNASGPTSIGHHFAMRIRQNSWGNVGDFGDNSYASPDSYGSQAGIIYMESNTYNDPKAEGAGCFDNEAGTRLVFRFNINCGFVATHGNDSGGRIRSGRQLEVYNNNFVAVTSPEQSTALFLRGGTGLIFNNTFNDNGTATYSGSKIQLINYRDSLHYVPWGASYAAGACDGTGPFDTNDGVTYASGTATSGSAVDALVDNTKSFTTNQWAGYSIHNFTQNWGSLIISNTATGVTTEFADPSQNSTPHNWSIGDSYQILHAYPCMDQVGVGQSVLIANTLPTPVGAINNASSPFYQWLNLYTTGNVYVPINNRSAVINSHAHILVNRDYYDYAGANTTSTSPGNGTVAVGSGTLAQRPATCTTGVAYWATDQGSWNTSGSGGQGVLYKCTSTNTWTLFYTPLVFPHPLVTGGGTPAVSLSPSSLSFGNVSVGSTSPSQTIQLTNTGGASLGITSIALTGTNPADFSQSNNCGSAVLAGGSCSIVVTCTPASAASFSANVSITDNAAGSPQTAALTCTGVTTAPAITFTPTQIAFASQNVGSSSAATPITVTNSGTATLNISQVLVSGGNSTSFTQTNNCTIALQPLDQCTVFVTFKPTVAGNLTSCICFTDNAPGSPQSVVVTGTGVGTAGIGFAPTSLAFGNQTLSSTSSALSVTVSNSGSAAISLSSVTATGTNAADFAISANTCGTSIAVGGSCVVQVKFTPGAIGSRTANLSFTDNAPASPQTVALSGTGTQAGAGFSPTSLAFGNQNTATTSAPLTTTLTNTGTASLNITSITIAGTNASDFFIASKTCGTTLAVAGTCTVSVTFTPAISGVRSASLLFTDNAPASPQTVPLTGTGIQAALAISPSSLSFPSTVLGHSATQTIAISNTSGVDVTVSSIAISGGNAGDFSQSNTCGSVIAQFSSCSAIVTFNPTIVGARSSALVLTDSAPGSPQSVPVSGTGTQSGAQVSPTLISFPNQPVGTTSAASNVTLTNNGTATLNISGITLGGTDPSYFAISANTCGSTLAISSSCTVSLTFTPQTAIGATATLSFADDGPGTPQVVNLSGTGTTTGISFTPASLTFPGQNVSTTSAPLTFNILNTGNGTITISGITVVGTNFADFAQTNNCGSSLGPNSSCTVSVKFTPSSTGTRTASVSVADNAANSPQSVALQGVGQTSSPIVCLSQTALVFGNQTVGTTSNPQVVIVSNTGTVALTISSATVTGANPGDFGETTTCGGGLAPNASCTYSFVFTPTAAGTRGATFNLTTNAPSSPDTVTLSGTGISSPTVQPGPAPQVFGDD